jgi:hypothetical protein
MNRVVATTFDGAIVELLEVEWMREIKFRGKEIETNEWVYGWVFGKTSNL